MPCEPDGGMNNCTSVRCPCPPDCEGTLRADRRNRQDTLTFLICDVCACAYVAEDLKAKEPNG
jgi:hypothetical protein